MGQLTTTVYGGLKELLKYQVDVNILDFSLHVLVRSLIDLYYSNSSIGL